MTQFSAYSSGSWLKARNSWCCILWYWGHCSVAVLIEILEGSRAASICVCNRRNSRAYRNNWVIKGGFRSLFPSFTNISSDRSNLMFKPQKPKINPHVEPAFFFNCLEIFWTANQWKVSNFNNARSCTILRSSWKSSQVILAPKCEAQNYKLTTSTQLEVC